ncbi:MAG: RNA polymerase sigma factor [Planctomycetes bacterium]|nr:RNA polymerase sigma factor [Planctomycetota bacterium]
MPALDEPTELATPDRPAPQAGDGAELQPFVDKIHRFLRCLGASRTEAEDLTQEAFLAAARKGKLALPPAARLSFLRRAARFQWLRTRRRSRREEAAIAELSLQLWEHELPDDGEAMLQATRACVRELTGRAGLAVGLAYRDGASRTEIAGALGMAENGVKTLLARTRHWLQRCITRRTR